MWLMKPMLYLSTAKAHTRQSMTISLLLYQVYQVLIKLLMHEALSYC